MKRAAAQLRRAQAGAADAIFDWSAGVADAERWDKWVASTRKPNKWAGRPQAADHPPERREVHVPFNVMAHAFRVAA